jgi:hypothetical protein
MSTPPVKGSVVVADGNGRVKVISPTSDGELLMLDSADANGARFQDLASLLPKQTQKAAVTSQTSVSSNAYVKMVSLTIPGENSQAVSDIKVLAYKGGNATSYNVRVYDVTNDAVIAEAAFTNASQIVQSMGTLSNLPAAEAVIEVQVRKNDGNNQSEVTVEEVQIEY